MRNLGRPAIVLSVGLVAVICGFDMWFTPRVVAAPPQGPPASTYHLSKKVVLGGDGGWDYLFADSDTHRVFLSRGSHTMVVDAEGKVLADIPKTDGVHGIAIAPEFNRGFTSNGRANTVTIFNLATLQVTGEVKVNGENPDTIIYDPSSKRVFTFNGRTNNASAIDAKTGEVAGVIDLGGKPETAQADGAGHIYANIEDKSTIVALDSKSLRVLSTWPLAPCESPSGLAIDAANHRLFAGCHNKMMAVVDSTNGKIVATPPIGDGVDADSFDPGTGFAFASCGDGTITVVHEDSPDKFTVVDTIMTQRGARTMTVDTKSHTVYTVTSDFAPAPAATPENPRPRPQALPNTFTILIYALGAGPAASAAAPSGAATSGSSGAGGAAVTTASSTTGDQGGSLVAKGKSLFNSYGCYECHGMNGEGTDNAPDLIGTRLSGPEIAQFLQKPSADAQTKGMPNVAATSPDLQPLVAYVLTLKKAQ